MKLKLFALKNSKNNYKYYDTELNGISIIETDSGKYGLYDEHDKRIILNPTYDRIYDILEEGTNYTHYCFKIKKDKEVGIIKDGKIILFSADFLDSFNDGISIITKNHRQGVVKENGEILLPTKYKNINIEEEGDDRYKYFKKRTMLVEQFDNTNGIFDYEGKQIIPFKNIEYIFKYEKITEQTTFDYDSIRVRDLTNKLIGFINLTGKEIVPLKYLQVNPFYEGLASVCKSLRKYGYIDKTGKEIIKFKYEIAFNFNNGYALVGRFMPNYNRKYGLIDKTGKEILPIVFSEDKIDRYKNDPLKWIKTIKGLYESDPEGLMQTLNVYEKDYDWEGWYNQL